MRFFNLNKHLSRSFMFDWLPLHEITMLDNAVCGKIDRNIFLHLIQSDNGSFGLQTNGHYKLTKSLLTWICSREICVDEIFISGHKNREIHDLLCLLSHEIHPAFVNRIKSLRIFHYESYNAKRVSWYYNNVLWNLSSVRELCILNANKIKHDTLLTICKSPNLTALCLGQAKELSTDCMKVLSPGLVKISLESCVIVANWTQRAFSASSIVAMSERCTQLTDINLRGNTVTDIATLGISIHCLFTTELDLGRCSDDMVTDRALLSISQHLTCLVKLSITTSSVELTDTGISHLCNGCKDIKDLYLQLGSRVKSRLTVEAMFTVARKLLKLTSIDLDAGFFLLFSVDLVGLFLKCFSVVTYLSVDDHFPIRGEPNESVQFRDSIAAPLELRDHRGRRGKNNRVDRYFHIVTHFGTVKPVIQYLKLSHQVTYSMPLLMVVSVASSLLTLHLGNHFHCRNYNYCHHKHYIDMSELFPAVRACTMLQCLTISHCKCTGSILAAAIHGKITLTALHCYSLKLINDEGVETVLRSSPQLTSISFVDCSVDYTDPARFADNVLMHCENVQEFSPRSVQNELDNRRLAIPFERRNRRLKRFSKWYESRCSDYDFGE